jgi:acyl carrier protein
LAHEGSAVLQPEQIRSTIRSYLLEQFLPDATEASLAGDTPLVSSGVLDSLATLQVVSFLEDSFGIKVKARDVSVDNMDTVDTMVRFVLERAGQ